MNAVFKAINDVTRRQILDLLKERDMNAGEIAKQFNMTKPSISHHLDILKRADLVSTSKEGQFVIYTINTTVIDDLFKWIYNLKHEIHEKKANARNSNLGFTGSSDLVSD